MVKLKKYIENNKKIVGIVLIISALLILILYLFSESRNKSVNDGYKESDQTEITREATENTGESEIQTQEEWDGDSVGLDTNFNNDFGDCGLDPEILNKIDHSTDQLSEEVQLYLYSNYDIGNVESLNWDGIATIDYINKKVELTFDVDADTNCVVQCVYNQTAKTWSFYKYD